MDIRQLRYFVTIVEEGQITRAAKRLNISQPPLSNQLKLLEQELNVTLFERNSRNLTLTYEGQLLFEHAKRILKEYSLTLSEFDNLKSGFTGSLYIGTIGSSALSFLPKSIIEYQQLYPNINIQIFETATNLVLELLNDKTVELGIIREPFDHYKYDYFYIDNAGIYSEDDYFVAVGSKKWLSDFPQEQASIPFLDLEGKPLIIHRFYAEDTKRHAEEIGFIPKIVCTNENVVTSLLWAVQELGVAIVPQSSANLLRNIVGGNEMIVKKIIHPSISSNTALAWVRNTHLSPVANNFVKFVKKNYL